MQNDRKIKIATGTSRKSLEWHTQELFWSEFINRIAKPVVTTETYHEYRGYTKAKQDNLKDVGGFVGGELKGLQRRNDNASNRHLLTLDADSIPPGGTQAVINAVDGLGCAYAIYSTRKHESSAPRLRIIFPLDVCCSSDEYEPIARKMASYIGMQIFDPTTFEPVRLMYWPSTSIDGEFVFTFADKPFLSKDGMLGQYENWKDVASWPEVPGANKIRERSAKKQGDPLEKAGVVGAFCKQYNILQAIDEFIPGTYTSCADGRLTYYEGSTVGGAVLYQEGNFIFSHHATDPISGKLCNAFDLVRLHLFAEEDNDAKPDTPITQLPSFKAMCEFALKQECVAKVISAERYEKAQQSFANAPATVVKEDLDWIGKLQCSSQTGQPLKTIDNVLIILEHDPRITDAFYHDEFANRPVVVKALPWERHEGPYKQRQWTDEDDSGLRHYIEKIYGITGKERIYDAVAIYATSHKKHKIRDYLKALVWDGIPRLDTLLIDYFGVEDGPYARETCRKALTAAVARIMCPGIKYDYMLIVAGAQGIGKSTFFQYLGKDWYSDSLTTFEGRDAAEQLQGYWIIEAGELTGLNKSEMNAVKQFMSKTEDVYRMPYGRRTAAFPRSCIIVGTTNDTEFLKDRTGNRRFWPVDAGKIEPTKSVFLDLPGEVDQIWAEAYMRFVAGEKLYLEGASAQEAKEQQENHKESSPKEGIILEFLNKKVTVDWTNKSLDDRRAFWNFGHKDMASNLLVERNRICAAEIWCECFMGDLKQMRRTDALEINSILSSLEDWEKAKGTKKFGLYYGDQKGFLRNGNNGF